MRGQILNATAGNRGIILGENGSRYTFTPDEWGNSSFDAVQGMQVEFGVRGHLATDVRSLDPAPTYEAPSPLPRGPEPLRSALQHPVAAPGVSPSPRAGYPMSWREVSSTPEHLKTKKNTIGLLYIFTGPIAAMLVPLYLGYRVGVFVLIVGMLLFPILVVFWPLWAIAGIVRLAMSEETYLKGLHIGREHNVWVCDWTNTDARHCRTGECRYLR